MPQPPPPQLGVLEVLEELEDPDPPLEEYPSLYQPPPFNWKAVRDNLRLTLLPGEQSCFVRGESLNFCMTSKSSPQVSHTYSYIGMVNLYLEIRGAQANPEAKVKPG